MRYTFEEEFRINHPETVGETDRQFDLENYKNWLEGQLTEARKQLALYNLQNKVEETIDCGCEPETCKRLKDRCKNLAYR